MDAFHLPFGSLKVRQRGDLVWLEWQEADPGVVRVLLSQLPPHQQERLAEEWESLLTSIANSIRARLENE